MSTSDTFHAHVIGIPHIPSITEVNVRTGPALSRKLIFRVPVGTRNLQIAEVQEDAEQRHLNGKVFQWFRVLFSEGRTGWIRDDLINLTGNGSEFGYIHVRQETLAFNLHRTDVIEQPKPAEDSAEDGVGEAMTPDDVRRTEEHLAVDVTEESAQTAVPQPAIAECRAIGGVNMRSGPGTNHRVVGRFLHNECGDILEAADSQSGDPLKWVRLRYQGREDIWVRLDFLRLRGAFSRFGIAFEDMYPSPAPQSHWVRDFDPEGRFLPWPHDGWDKAGTTGAPILGGPQGGLVVQTAHCQFCGPNSVSVEEKGLRVGSSQVFVPGWNFGYGHYVIVRYDHDKLPPSTQNRLASMGRAGHHLFAMYAHLHSIMVQTGQPLSPNQQIGTMGNSGNSTGTHLHLEVRSGANAQFVHWANLRSGLLTPAILFLR